MSDSSSRRGNSQSKDGIGRTLELLILFATGCVIAYGACLQRTTAELQTRPFIYLSQDRGIVWDERLPKDASAPYHMEIRYRNGGNSPAVDLTTCIFAIGDERVIFSSGCNFINPRGQPKSCAAEQRRIEIADQEDLALCLWPARQIVGVGDVGWREYSIPNGKFQEFFRTKESPGKGLYVVVAYRHPGDHQFPWSHSKAPYMSIFRALPYSDDGKGNQVKFLFSDATID